MNTTHNALTVAVILKQMDYVVLVVTPFQVQYPEINETSFFRCDPLSPGIWKTCDLVYVVIMCVICTLAR